MLGAIAGARITPVPIAVAAPAILALGFDHACAGADALACWGDGRRGALGDVAAITPEPITLVASDTTDGCDAGVLVAPGRPHPSTPCQVCARGGAFTPCAFGCSAGVCLDVPPTGLPLAFGVPFDARDGHFCTTRRDGAVICWRAADPDGAATTLVGASDTRAVAVAADEVCTLDGASTVRCWSAPEALDAPAVVLTDATYLAAGPDGACAIQAGIVHCWRPGQAPSPRVGPAAAVTVAVGAGATCALGVAPGDPWCWRGDDPAAAIPSAQRHDLVHIVGAEHFLVVDGDGAIGGWGANDVQQIAAELPALLDQQVFPNSLRALLTRPLRQLAVASRQTCALSLAGQVACWGAAPPAPPLAGVTHLATTAAATCAIQDGVHLVCWSADASAKPRFPAGTR